MRQFPTHHCPLWGVATYDRTWPKPPVDEPELNGWGRGRKFVFHRTRTRERSPIVRSNMRGQIAGGTGRSAWLSPFKGYGSRGQVHGGAAGERCQVFVGHQTPPDLGVIACRPFQLVEVESHRPEFLLPRKLLARAQANRGLTEAPWAS